MSSDTSSKSSQPQEYSWFRHFFQERLKIVSLLYALMLPSIISLIVFSYYPKLDVIVKSFYRWEPPVVEEFVGLKNFMDAAADPLFWSSFELVGILLVTNVIKMVPGIFAAIAVHRVLSDKLRYYYQVAFVVPMIVPAIVWMLMWKGFYDPDFGIVNKVLNGTGLMGVLQFLDGTQDAPGLMPQIASAVQGFSMASVEPIFGSAWGALLAGAMIFTLKKLKIESPSKRIKVYATLLASAFLLPVILGLGFVGGLGAVVLGLVLGIALMVVLAKQIGDSWILWPFIILAGIVMFLPQGELIRLPILLAGSMIVVTLAFKLFSFFKADSLLNWLGSISLIVGAVVILFGMVWTEPTEQFIEGKPAWLGSESLIIPAIIFWGFPWVGAVSVLIFLSGLQQISEDVYEAADLDGLSSFGKVIHLELPLIMTQVRISLIMLTISTLNAYEQFLILLGPSGGVGNKGMVPGLYMFKKAFEEREFGYACALGMVLFILILLLTVIYNKYVKVDK